MYIMYDGARLPPRDEHFVDVKHQAKSNAWRTWVGVACLFFFWYVATRRHGTGANTRRYGAFCGNFGPSLGETYVCYCATEAACYCCVTSKQAMLGDGSLASTPCMMLQPGRMNVSKKAVGRMVQ